MSLQRIRDFFLEDWDAGGVQRVFFWILIIVGIGLVGEAAYQEYRGVTDRPTMSGSGRYPTIYSDGRISRDQNPEAFRGAMQFHWFYACVTLFAGLVLRSIIRAEDRADPFAPDEDAKDEK